jgi:Pro-kumamolisin, activation domain
VEAYPVDPGDERSGPRRDFEREPPTGVALSLTLATAAEPQNGAWVNGIGVNQGWSSTMTDKIPANYRVLGSSERKPRAGARRTGAADPKEVITVSLRLRRRTDAPALPDLADLAATRRGEKHYLSREDFAAHYGASSADIDRVVEFAKEHKFDVVESSVARRTVVLKGTVAQMSKAFAVDLGIYETPKEKYRGREGAVHVPAAIADIVEGVFGLDNRKMAEPQFKMHGLKATEASPGQATVPLTPPQVAQLYGFPTTPNAAGQTIGILEFDGGYNLSDVKLFYQSVGVPLPSITPVSIDGVPNNPNGSAAVETLLDIDVAGAAAPGAKIAVYFAPWSEQGWVDAVTTAVHDTVNRPSAISISYGWPELNTIENLTWSLAAIKAVSATFQEAAAMGVTVLVSAGDHGSDCGMGDGKAHVLYPGSDPYVTSCGGTSLSNVSGLNFTEHVWNDNDDEWITGGGVSDVFFPPNFPLPVWQGWANVPGSANDGHKARAIPDIAGNADGASGYVLYQNGASIGAVGGTSATAPLYAGLVALLNADFGEPVGYLNPNLYAMPYSYVYRDINDNISNARDGAPGYKSVAGWDACTGLGSVNGTALGNALRGVGLPVALAPLGANLVMTWKGIERDDRVFFSTFNGNTWTAQQQVPGIGSSAGPALTPYAGKLFMAWKGMNDDQGIYTTTFNGTTWAPQNLVTGIGSSVGPRLATLGNNVFMAWKGVEGDQRIFFSQFNGSSWTPQQFVPNVATSVGPAVVNFNGSIYMVWKGMNGDQGLWWSKFNGTSFAPQQQIAGVGSSEGPSLAVFNNTLYAVWKGIFGDQSLWYSSFNGTAWAPQKQIAGVASSVGPGIAVLNNALVACWKGELGDQGIWYSQFNGSTWTPQQKIPGVGTSPDLVDVAA